MISDEITDAAFRCAQIHTAQKDVGNSAVINANAVENVYIHSADTGSTSNNRQIYNRSRLDSSGFHRIRWCGFGSPTEAATNSTNQFNFSNFCGRFNYKGVEYTVGGTWNIHDVREFDNMLFISSTKRLVNSPSTNLHYVDLNADNPVVYQFGEFTTGSFQLDFDSDDVLGNPQATYGSSTIDDIGIFANHIWPLSMQFSKDGLFLYAMYEYLTNSISPPTPIEPGLQQFVQSFYLKIPLSIQDLPVPTVNITRAVVASPGGITETAEAIHNGIYTKFNRVRDLVIEDPVTVFEELDGMDTVYRATYTAGTGSIDSTTTLLGFRVLGQHIDDVSGGVFDVVVKATPNNTAIVATETRDYKSVGALGTPDQSTPSGSVTSTASKTITGRFELGLYLKDSLGFYEYICDWSVFDNYDGYTAEFKKDYTLGSGGGWSSVVVDNYQTINDIPDGSDVLNHVNVSYSRLAFCVDLDAKIAITGLNDEPSILQPHYDYVKNGNGCDRVKKERSKTWVTINGVETIIEDIEETVQTLAVTVFSEQFLDADDTLDTNDSQIQGTRHGLLGSVVGTGDDKYFAHLRTFRDPVAHPSAFDDKAFIIDAILNLPGSFLTTLNGGVDFSTRHTSNFALASGTPVHYIVGMGD